MQCSVWSTKVSCECLLLAIFGAPEVALDAAIQNRDDIILRNIVQCLLFGSDIKTRGISSLTNKNKSEKLGARTTANRSVYAVVR